MYVCMYAFRRRSTNLMLDNMKLELHCCMLEGRMGEHPEGFGVYSRTPTRVEVGSLVLMGFAKTAGTKVRERSFGGFTAPLLGL